MRRGEYSADTIIGDIKWNSHFTDLRVTVTNPSDTDYENLDLAVWPDNLTHKAALVTKVPGCDVMAIGGNRLLIAHSKTSGNISITGTHAGEDFDVHDSAGNIYTPLATETGYRVRCTRLPAHFTIHIVFALVTADNNFRPSISTGWGWKATDVGPLKSDFDVLGSRPSPSSVTIRGRYMRNLKPYSVLTTTPVADGS